jgi:hypothetical protein
LLYQKEFHHHLRLEDRKEPLRRFIHRFIHSAFLLRLLRHGKMEPPPDPLQVVEYNPSFNKANSFSATMAEGEGIKGYIRGSVKDIQSLLKDPENNYPLPEDQFSKVEDERAISRCKF